MSIIAFSFIFKDCSGRALESEGSDRKRPDLSLHMPPTAPPGYFSKAPGSGGSNRKRPVLSLRMPPTAPPYYFHKCSYKVPEILVTGICATQRDLPCCSKTLLTLRDLCSGITDLSYPKCRDDGYFKPKQCGWWKCWCVDKNGQKAVKKGPDGCPGLARAVPTTD